MTDPKQILATPMQEGNDAGAETIGDYLISLLRAVWDEKEGFSGKRPFGNSGWAGDLQAALIDAGHVEGSLDEYGYINSVDSEAVNRLIDSAIGSLSTAWSG